MVLFPIFILGSNGHCFTAWQKQLRFVAPGAVKVTLDVGHRVGFALLACHSWVSFASVLYLVLLLCLGSSQANALFPTTISLQILWLKVNQMISVLIMIWTGVGLIL
jgi:hypothetical protein